MSLKKNAVSYVIWMIMLLFTGAAVAFLSMIAARQLDGNSILAAVGFIAVFFVILCLIYFLTGLLLSYIKIEGEVWKNIKSSWFLEGLVIGMCVSAGIAVRVFLLPTAGEDAAYFELAKVTQQGGIAVQAVQGSVYYYCLLLHGLLRLFGNHWMVGIWLQIFLQAFSSILLYFAVRRLTGKVTAILLLMFMNFMPMSTEAGLTYSPQMLYLCIFGIVFLLLADYLRRSSEETSPVFMWIYTVMVGMAIGFVCYVDITGILLLLLVCCIGMVKRATGNALLLGIRFFVLVASAVAFFCGMIWVDSILSGSTFLRVINAWYVTYSSIEWNFNTFSQNSQLELLLLPMLIAFGVFSFWRRKDGERFTPYVIMAVGISTLHFTGITVNNMDGSYLLFVIFAALASVSISELFYKAPVIVSVEKVQDVPKNHQKEESVKERPMKDKIKEQSKEKVEGIDLEKNEQPKAEAKMIENPLPVPKKKERKGMDYAFIPKPSQMMYDIRVSDSDDFDI